MFANTETLQSGDRLLGDLAELIAQHVYTTREIQVALRGVDMPWQREMGKPLTEWREIVQDALLERRLPRLLEEVARGNPTLGRALADLVAEGLRPPKRDPSGTAPVRPLEHCLIGRGRALINRHRLREALHELVSDRHRVLLVCGPQRSGKSHTYQLLRHVLRPGEDPNQKLVRIECAEDLSFRTGESLLVDLAHRLGLNADLPPSLEPDETRARTLLNIFLASFPQDRTTRWIVLDGLDLPHVRESTRDVARRLVTLVNDDEIPRARLIVIGLDPDTVPGAVGVPVERIARIDKDDIAHFLVRAARESGHRLTVTEAEGLVGEVLVEPGEPADLHAVERRAMDLVGRLWAPGDRRAG